MRISHIVLMPGRDRTLYMKVISGSGLPANFEFLEDGLEHLEVVM